MFVSEVAAQYYDFIFEKIHIFECRKGGWSETDEFDFEDDTINPQSARWGYSETFGI